jgi:putative restriction endonuclease
MTQDSLRREGVAIGRDTGVALGSDLTVCAAYDNTCAVTGLRIVNGGGRSEVQAAHIWPVADGGPDVVQNGLALSGTVHWLFDRHLIWVSDDYRLLVSHNKVPTDLQQLFANQLNRIRLPSRQSDWPNPAFLRQHRDAAMLRRTDL